MKAVHFGAGNIGRGFIGETLYKNGFYIDFVDVNETVVDALAARHSYEIEYSGEKQSRATASGVNGINSKKDPDAVINAVSKANLITTAIGPNILPFIAELLAKGLHARRLSGNKEPVDVIACENMIGGSEFLREQTNKYLDAADKDFVSQFIGFPNAAVDRIVPAQKHSDPLFVSVEAFHEWVVDDSGRKARHITLSGVEYAKDLQPYIERKLFTVNSGHASCAYSGAYYGCKYIHEAVKDDRVLSRLKGALDETGGLLIAKWGFNIEDHKKYAEKTLERFANPAINDSIQRVARTPIRKLGKEERFIRPIRELTERGLPCKNLLEMTAFVLSYNDKEDEESVRLQKMLRESPLSGIIKSITSLEDDALIKEIAAHYETLQKMDSR
ncbi:MAG: mannitol-1-phosphate 5-dehydrogenase [Spirochaetaceae bacterium]|jgi:mannitol-1-phosphate 5-dehydrogenase|nr:mannitol-1-phosphate 5-dehydrogenase [Spirochaetaceae bacterium]